MEKTFKNGEILEIVDKLSDPNSLLNTSDPTKKLSVKILWKIDGNFRKLRDIAQRVYEKRATIENIFSDDSKSEEVSISEETGETVRRVKPEYLKDFHSQLNELLEIENTIDLEYVPISAFDEISLVPSDFISIRFMIDGDEGGI